MGRKIKELPFHGFVEDQVTLHPDDCREVLRGLPDASIDSVVTDPPYALVSIGKRFGKPDAAPAGYGRDGAYARASRGFMGKTWDTGETAFAPGFWGEVLRVLKPGGHVVAFAGTRTYHRLACAVEDAGFEIRDQLGWVYGSGFPKSHDAGDGWGTALKPAWEPIVLARRPLVGTVAANVLVYGTGALNIDGCRVESGARPHVVSDRRLEHNTYAPGLGGSKAAGSTETGRWPANVIHDGSDEVTAAFPDTTSGAGVLKRSAGTGDPAQWRTGQRESEGVLYGDTGSAARFFYAAKASAADRAGSKHPTVKPVSLMRWLVRLITPPGGVVLDPFAGSGTTGAAAYLEGMRCVLVEREAEYQTDIRRRLWDLQELVCPGFQTEARP